MTIDKTSWTELNFIERQMTPIFSLDDNNKQIKWIDFECSSPDKKWIYDANVVTMDFGGVFHSIFLRWAVTINGIHVASEKYSSKDWLESGKSFAIHGIRNSLDGTPPKLVPVSMWDGEMASKVHISSSPMLSAWAFCNMYSCLEEFIFKLFRVFLESHPMNICKGDEFKDIRRAYKERGNSEQNLTDWNEKWMDRLNSWHRKKIYDGIEKVFTSFVEQCGLQIPSDYKREVKYTDVARSLGGISMIRNCFIHGATRVPQELGDFCNTFQGLFFQFKSGDKFEITLNDLAILEYFTDTFTQTLNTSFLELAYPGITNLTDRALGS